VNSKRKGKVGELELAKKLREYGFETRRSQQYAGGTEESSDIVGLPYIHIECKRVEKLNIDDAMEQAENDSNPFHGGLYDMSIFHNTPSIPSVFHRKNGKKWKVTMYLDDWMKLYQKYYSGKQIEKGEN
jgi:hypothetical protein